MNMVLDVNRLQNSIAFRANNWSNKLQILALKSKYILPSIDINELILPNIQVPPPILDDACMPPYDGRFVTHDDYLPLMSLVVTLRPKIVLELGTAFGNTVANLCNISADSRILTVNAPATEQSGSVVTYELTQEQIGRVYKKYGFSPRVEQIYSNTLSLDLAKYLPHNSIDLAVIDACHDTDYVINDFYKVVEFISSGGVVLFHDTHPTMNGHLVGSYRACMMLRRDGYDIKHVKNTWWGIWCKT